MKNLRYIKTTLMDGRLNFFFFLVLVFSLPLSRQISTIAIWPWILTWIIEGKYRQKFNRKNIICNIHSLTFLPGLLILMLLSVLWSTDKANGLNQIGTQSSLLIIPIVLSFSNDVYKRASSFKMIILSLGSGIIVISVFLLIKAILHTVTISDGQVVIDPIINQWDNAFFFLQFSYLIHPTYLGLMVLTVLMTSILDIRKNFVINGHSLLKYLIIVYLIFIVFLLSSKSIISVSIVLSIFLLWYIEINKFYKVLGMLLLASGILLMIIFNPRIAWYRKIAKDHGIENVFYSDLRAKIWKSSTQLIKEKPVLGVGKGDVRNKLEKIYQKDYNQFSGVYNCHNQYLEIWLSSGVITLLILIIGMFLPLFSKKLLLPKIYYAGFIFITSFIFLFESILCRFWGVLFYGIFYTLLTRNKYK